MCSRTRNTPPASYLQSWLAHPRINYKTMNNIKELNIYNEGMANPAKTLSSHGEMSKFIGAVNVLVYGTNPFEKVERNPLENENEAEEGTKEDRETKAWI